MSALWRLSAREALAGLSVGTISSAELVEACLERISAEDERLQSFVTVCGERARREAAASDAARRAGAAPRPLEGLPFAVKDVTPTQGVRTTFGSLVFADHVPEADELCVARLRAAGAILIGKTNTPEFGFGPRSVNFLRGPTANPHDLQLSSGGSSGGSAAAVAAGLVPVAHGADFGGSVRTPASFCGVVGYRPTPGLIPQPGKSFAWNALATTGSLARYVDDAALLARVMAGFDPRDPLSHPCDGIGEAAPPASPRLAVSADLGVAPVAKAVREAFSAAVARLSAHFPDIEEAAPNLEGGPQAFATLRAALVRAQFAPLVEAHRAKLTSPLIWNVDRGSDVSLQSLMAAEAQRGRAYVEALAFFERFDFLITPAASVAPFRNDIVDVMDIDGEPLATPIDYLAITYLVSLLGLPSLAVPAGSVDGAPFGLQIVAPPFADAALIAFGRALENEVGFRFGFPDRYR